MDISLNNLSKRYRFEWIIRDLSYQFKSGQRYAICGPNGSGKSTLLKILSGHLSPSKGEIKFSSNGSAIDTDEVFRSVAIAAPYIDLIEEFSLREMIKFHIKFKSLLDGQDVTGIIKLLGFENSTNKELKFFSSGMRQRLKLALAFCSDTTLLLLDEPTTNLDEEGVKWYHRLVEKYGRDRTLIIASNVNHDFDFCENKLDIMDYKKRVGS